MHCCGGTYDDFPVVNENLDFFILDVGETTVNQAVEFSPLFTNESPATASVCGVYSEIQL